MATNTSVLELGAVPVDIQYDTLNIDPNSVAEKLLIKLKQLYVFTMLETQLM